VFEHLGIPLHSDFAFAHNKLVELKMMIDKQYGSVDN
jgi:hypothetical protein